MTDTGTRWYQIVYRLIYRLGLPVWQRSAPAAGLVALLDGPDPLPPGRALDLGCGTGTDAIHLAARGWDVTAVDMVPRALAIARRNAGRARVVPRFVQGDVTRLSELGIGGDHTLLLDFGCLHTLPEDRRSAYVAEVGQAAATDAVLLLYGFRRPPRAAPMRAGLTVDDVRRLFVPAGWQIVSAEPALDEAAEIAVLRAGRRFELWRYQLCRR